jgi:hypothetical protein
MAAAALARVQEFINRAAAQNIRRMQEEWARQFILRRRDQRR